MNIKAVLLPAFALAVSSSAHAQDEQVQQASYSAPVAVAVQPATWTLPANTELTVTPNSDVSSKSMKEEAVFTISTVYDVMMNNYIVIPKGTRGQGKITWRTGKGAFGKSAKLDLAFTWIEI